MTSGRLQDRRRGRRVLDELEQRRCGKSPRRASSPKSRPTLKADASTCDGKPAVLEKVLNVILQAADEALAARIDQSLRGGRVAQQAVGRRDRVDQNGREEMGSLLVHPVQTRAVDEPVERLRPRRDRPSAPRCGAGSSSRPDRGTACLPAPVCAPTCRGRYRSTRRETTAIDRLRPAAR